MMKVCTVFFIMMISFVHVNAQIENTFKDTKIFLYHGKDTIEKTIELKVTKSNEHIMFEANEWETLIMKLNLLKKEKESVFTDESKKYTTTFELIVWTDEKRMMIKDEVRIIIEGLDMTLKKKPEWDVWSLDIKYNEAPQEENRKKNESITEIMESWTGDKTVIVPELTMPKKSKKKK